jgi:Uma2 family endonuclease
MGTATRTKDYTFEDFCLLVKDGQKADLIDGVIYMASPDNNDANRLCGWLLTLMDMFVEANDLGDMFFSRSAFCLDAGNSPEPDIAFVRKERLHLVQRGFTDGPPDLAVEIVSPESVERDYKKKRSQYQRAGVLEYWIIDEIEEKVTLLRLAASGRYREVRPRNGALASEAMPGFWLRAEWLWQTPRPKKAKVLKMLLGRNP